MSSIYEPVKAHVNLTCRANGHRPGPNPLLQAATAGYLYRENVFGITTVTAATIAAGSNRPAVDAMLAILQSGDAVLLAAVLDGTETLKRGGAWARSRTRLIEAVHNATPDDLVALGRAIGPTALFDRIVAPALL
jgi:hypothetical protein